MGVGMSNVPKLRFKGFDDVWTRTELSKVALLERGKFTPRPRNDPKFYGGDTPFVQTSDVVKSKGYIRNYSQTLNEEGLKVSKVFDKGTILITIAANIGFTGILESDMACPDSLIGIKCNEATDNRFLNQRLIKEQQRMDYLAIDGAQKNINLDFLRPYVLCFPQKNEQQKIADFLTAVDTKIEQLTRKEELLKQYKKGVMQKIFSQEIRFKADDGSEFPEWEEKKLGEVFKIASGMSKSSFIQATGKNIIVDMGGISSTPKLIAKKCTDYDSDYLTTNDLVMPKDDIGGGLIIGKVVAIPENNKYICGDHIYKLTLLSGEIGYLQYAINSYSINKSFRRKANGTAQIGLNRREVESQQVPFPCIEEQRKVYKFLRGIERKLDNVNLQIDTIKDFKKGLLQQMFV